MSSVMTKIPTMKASGADAAIERYVSDCVQRGLLERWRAALRRTMAADEPHGPSRAEHEEAAVMHERVAELYEWLAGRHVAAAA